MQYLAASNHRIKNEGEANFLFETPEGQDEDIVFQVAEVNKALLAVSDRVDHNYRVVFDKDQRSGQDLSYMLEKNSGKVLKLRRERNVWVLDAIVPGDAIGKDYFARRG